MNTCYRALYVAGLPLLLLASSGCDKVTLPYLFAGAGSAGQSGVRSFEGTGGAARMTFNADNRAFAGGVRVAAGDFNADGTLDLVSAAGPGGTPHVVIQDGADGRVHREFDAFNTAFTGGLFVAAGDVNGDGVSDVIVGADAGAGPQVQVYDGSSLQVLSSFFAYGASFAGGVRVAAGDVNGDGIADIITGTGAGSAGHVKVFDGASLLLLHSFFAFDTSFTGGVFVAAGDVNGDGMADIIVGADAGAAPHVKVFSGGSEELLHSFFAFAQTFTGGVRVASADVDGDGKSDVVTAAGPGGGPVVKVFSGADGTERYSFFAFDPTFSGGVFVAAGTGRVSQSEITNQLSGLNLR